MAATYSAEINGIDRALTHVLLDGFKINEVTNGINTLVCEVGSEDASFRPVKRQEIEIYEDDGTSPVRLIFGGTIRMVRERGWGEIADGIDGIIQAVSADSFKTLASRRFVTASFPSQSLEATFTSVVNTYLGTYGVTVDPAQATGPTLEAMEFELVRVDDVFNFLATLSAKYGAPFIWTIGYDKVAGMYQTGTVAAPWNLVEGDGTEVGDVEVEPTDESYANKVWVLWGSGTVVAVQDEVVGTGNGVQTTFTLSKQLVGPGIPGTNTAVGWGYVTSNGIFETLGDLGTGAMWEYDPANNTITRTIGAPGVGHLVTMSYHGELRGTVFAQDAGEIASFGLWEDKILAPEIETEALAQTVADAELARRLLTGKIVRFKTDRLPAPVPGDTLTITVPKRNISGSFTVTDVATENYPGDANTLLRTITCGSNIHEQSHQTLTRWWSEKDTNGITQPAGSGAVPGPPPYSVQWNDSTSGQAIFGGAYHILYYDLFWSQPDLFTSPPEVKSKGLLFVQNQDLGAGGHIGITDPFRVEMGMIGSGNFSIDNFAPEGTTRSIFVNASQDIILTAGTSANTYNHGSVSLVGNRSMAIDFALPAGNTIPAVSTLPNPFGDSYTRFHRLNAIDGICGNYQTISALPYTINTTPASDQNEFHSFINTAGTGTITLPPIGSALSPSFRVFPITAVGRILHIVNVSGTLTVDGNAGETINGDATITLGPTSAVIIQRHDTGWKILASHGAIGGGGGGGSLTIGGDDKDVQFNDGGVLGGQDEFEWDKTKGQLSLKNVAAYSLLRLENPLGGSPNDVGGPVVVDIGSANTAFLGFGREFVSGTNIARLATPGYFWHQNDDLSSPAFTGIGAGLHPGQTPDAAMSFSSERGFYIDPDGIFYVYQSGGLGSGHEGTGIYLQRNTTGDGASAFAAFENLNGDANYLWHDEFRIPRWGYEAPGEGGSPSGDTDGLRLSPEIIVIADSDESDSDNTLHADAELFFSVEADTVYLIDVFLVFNTGTSNVPDAQFNFTFPASATLTFGGSSLAPTATVSGTLNMIGHHQVATPSVAQPVGVLTTGSLLTSPVILSGVLRVAGTAGTFQLQWAQNTTTGGTPTVRRADSYIRATKVRTT